MAHQEEQMMKAVHGLVTQNLDTVEAEIDSTVDKAKETVHELRSDAQEAADRTLSRFKGLWEQGQERLEAQMASHPWILLAGLLVVGLLLSRRSQRAAANAGAERYGSQLG